MRIRIGKCNIKDVNFNDIGIGDVLIFPNNPGWVDHIFMRVWHKEGYDKLNRELDRLYLVRLDDGVPSTWRPNNTEAGQTYTLTRDMMNGKVNTSDGKKFCPIIINATLCLEEQS